MQSNAEKAEKLNFLSGQILDAAIEVHKELGGPGLLETIYEEALTHELIMRKHAVKKQLPVPIQYKGRVIKKPLVLDLLIDNQIIIEVKSIETLNPVYQAQVLTYLRLTNRPLGLVINFGERYIKNGFYRVVNKFPGG